MYKFTNGVVVFTEEDKENYIKAGYILVEEKKDKTSEKNDKGWFVAKEYKRSDEEPGRVHKSFK